MVNAESRFQHVTAMNTPSTPTHSTANLAQTHFTVRIDRHGAVLIDCHAGADHAETGVRGLMGLVQRGWMAPPHDLHVDPLLEHVEIDGVRYPCDPDGVHQLEAALNSHYTRPVDMNHDAIQVRENPASPTGFDLHYVTERYTVRHEINTHLGPEALDQLQDPARCDLIRTDAVIRMNPPHLVARRKHPDGGESPIPELPDLEYWRSNATAVQRMLNHPAVARRGVAAPVNTPVLPPATVPTPPVGPAAGVANPPRPAAVAAVKPTAPPPHPAPPIEPPLPAEVAALFPKREPGSIQREVFDALCADVDFPCDDIELTLPPAFEGRHFRVLNFDRTPVENIMDLRGTEFRGFYLTELRQHGADLVYACRGIHLEWCSDECVLQPGPGVEALEFAGPALLGLAQDANRDFLFLVDRGYREWIRPHEPLCALANARFATLAEWAPRRHETTLIWPVG